MTNRGAGTYVGVALALAAVTSGCGVGEGSGFVRSDRLRIDGCWSGPFDLKPDFFGANPYQEESLLIRIQRGDNIESQSDGLLILVKDLQNLRQRLEEPISEVGLPPGVSPPGVPITYNPDPPKVSFSLYLKNSCHGQNAAVYAISGSITFHSLFSGDPNESNAEDRLTSADFTAKFADPRKIVQQTADENGDLTSDVTGSFRFYFQRGQPAQPFQ